ncbi:MAG: flagellar filament capping protein FliD [Deltaproteobacteria bacterium]|nr:flagellar filament capping protein FliD [Deltaproteobacteria bacterium]
MADYISGSINFQGLGSGTDFGSIIAQLKKIESIPMQRMERWKADWQARAQAFETVLQSMREAKAALSLINSRDKFVSKLTASSNPQIATLSATGKALDGAHSIEVTQLASNAIWSCQTEYASKNAAISTQNTQFTYTYKGQTRTLQIAGNTSLESFVNMVNNDPQNKGIRASIVQSGSTYRLQIQGKDSGSDATLSITPTAGLNFLGSPAWQSSQSYAGTDTIWSAGTGAGEFRYTLGFGSEQIIAITNTTTADDLINAINSASGPNTASLDANGNLIITGATSVRGPATAGTIGASYWTSSNAYGPSEAVTPIINAWKSDNSVTGLNDVIHSGAGQFNITVNGTTRSILVADNTSLQDLVAKINTVGFGQIASAEAINGDPANGYVLRINGATNFTGVNGATLTGSSAPDGTAKAFTFNIGSENFSVDVFPGVSTAQDLVNAVNEAYRAKHAGAADVASLVQNASGNYTIQIAGAASANGAGVNGSSGQAANGLTITPDSWTSLRSFASAGDIAIPTNTWQSDTFTSARSPSYSLGNAAGDFEFTVNGTSYSVAVDANASLQDIANAINAQGLGKIASVTAVDPTDLSQGYTLNIEGASAAGGINGLSLNGSATAVGTQTFSFSVDGTNYSCNLAPGASAQDVVDTINATAGSTVAALVTDPNDSSRLAISLDGASVSQNAGLQGANIVTSTNGAISGNSMSGSFTFGGWVVQEPQNAKFKLDNWPDELESTSNNISGVLDGVTITVFDLGKAQISIATDTDSVRQNIQNFLDAVNSVLLTIRELSKVDDSTSGYNFSVTNKDDKSAAAKKIGSVLTGNYGVQLLNSRMQSLATGMPSGFQKIMGSDLLSGDLISSLSQIGIKTVSDKSDPNYGLLVIAPSSIIASVQDMDEKSFDAALGTKLDALLDFFACDDEGSSTSADFRYASHVKGGTKAGTYDVSYTVSYAAAAPNVPIIEVWIDGRKAVQDSTMEGYWFTSASGPSAGLAIQIDNLNEGTHVGKVSIKQGKVREMEDFFTAETKTYDSINHIGGALEILKRNYAAIMEGIDKKIEREQTRLSNWEQTQKLAFARLDTLLGRYNANQQRLEGEIAKLGPGIQ